MPYLFSNLFSFSEMINLRLYVHWDAIDVLHVPYLSNRRLYVDVNGAVLCCKHLLHCVFLPHSRISDYQHYINVSQFLLGLLKMVPYHDIVMEHQTLVFQTELRSRSAGRLTVVPKSPTLFACCVTQSAGGRYCDSIHSC